MWKFKANSPTGWKRRMAMELMLLAIVAAPLLAGMPRGEKHESRRIIEQLEDSWRNAMLHGNITAMEGLLADDYMAITPSGVLQSKEQALSQLRNGSLHFKSIEFDDRKVRFYGTTALVNCRAEISGAGPEGEFSGSYRYTRVYVRDAKGVWRIVSFEANRIARPRTTSSPRAR
jgi:ketosteroid isomerase-like protein